MSQTIRTFSFGDISVHYALNDKNRAVLLLAPIDAPIDLSSPKVCGTLNNASLAHLQLSHQSPGMFSNSYKLSESLDALQYKEQLVSEEDNRTVVTTVEEAEEGWGIRHHLTWYHGELGFEITTEFYNNSGRTLTLEYLTSASLDALSPYLPNEGSKQLVFHRFKAGWSMEGLLQSNTLTELGLESAWGMAGESLKLCAVGSRPVREYHPYSALEDTANGIIWGLSLAHNASWQMELSRIHNGVSLSAGLADLVTGQWSKNIPDESSFCSPTAMISVTHGSIAEISNRILSMRHRAIDAYGEEGMGIAYNDFVTTWGRPTESAMLKMADRLKKGKTKYLIMDAGWYTPYRSIGDWVVNTKAFPSGMKTYCEEVRKRGMIPGIWMEFECTDSHAASFAPEYDSMKLTKDGHVIVGHVINGRRESFFDFRKPNVVEYLDEKVIKFLRDSGFGYLKIDYNASIGAGIDGDDSPGENLRYHMELVREFVKKIKREIPDILIENCASGGCRLEPSMMDITGMSSASDTHEVYECAVVAANLHYLIPPRQSQVWCTMKPDFTQERFAYTIAQGFLGRLCWSGLLMDLNDDQMDQIFAAEEFYEMVAPIIKHGNSYIYRTDPCSFHQPTGTQALVRYSEDGTQAMVVVHSFEDSKELSVKLADNFTLCQALYPSEITLDGALLTVSPKSDFCGNVYYLKKAE